MTRSRKSLSADGVHRGGPFRLCVIQQIAPTAAAGCCIAAIHEKDESARPDLRPLRPRAHETCLRTFLSEGNLHALARACSKRVIVIDGGKVRYLFAQPHFPRQAVIRQNCCAHHRRTRFRAMRLSASLRDWNSPISCRIGAVRSQTLEASSKAARSMPVGSLAPSPSLTLSGAKQLAGLNTRWLR